MMQNEWDKCYDFMRGNWDTYKSASQHDTHSMSMYKIFKSYSYSALMKAVNEIALDCDRKPTFPTVSQISFRLKSSSTGYDFKDCPVCDTSGFVSMIHAYDPGHKDKHDYKYRKYSAGGLPEDANHYLFAYCCLCEAGQHMGRTDQAYITRDEFREIAEFKGVSVPSVQRQLAGPDEKVTVYEA